MKFEKKNISSQQVAFIKHIGHVEEMGMIIGKLMELIYKNNIQVLGGPFSIYYTDPSMVNPDEMVYDIAIPIAENVKIEDNEVKVKTLPETHVIATIHKGDYKNLNETYQGVWNYIVENKYEASGPPLEIYLNSPEDVSQDELLTEIQFPIKE